MLNVSMLNSYDYCSRKLFLEYVLGFKEPSKPPTMLGAIRHEAHDRVVKSEEKVVTSIKQRLSLEEIKALYKKFYREILVGVIREYRNDLEGLELNLGVVFKGVWPLILEESEKRAQNIFDFIKMHNIYGEELWQRLTPKLQTELRIESENLNLKGHIDLVEVYEKGYVPVELKTGSLPKDGVWPGHRVQLAAYAMLLEEHYKTEVKEGFVHYLDGKERRHLAINPFLKQEVMELIKKIGDLLNGKTIPPIVDNKKKCESCGLRADCYNEKKLNQRLKEKRKF